MTQEPIAVRLLALMVCLHTVYSSNIDEISEAARSNYKSPD